MKVSYSCMPDIDSAISSHNKVLLSDAPNAVMPCNCRDPTQCPFNGKCRTPATIYRGDVTAEGEPVSKYVGLSEPPIKERTANHRTSFNDVRHQMKTELSKKVWEMKLKDKVPVVTWSILRKTTPYRAGAKHCSLFMGKVLHHEGRAVTY